jgi:ABC-2 type transport system permease protein
VSTFLMLTRVEIALLLREPAALLFTLALPLLLLSLNGSGGNAAREGLGGFGVVDVMLPGYLLLVMSTSGLMALPETLAGYRERGFLRRLRLSPLRPWHVLGSHAATHLAMSLAGLALLVTVGVAAFGLNPPTAWPAAVAAIGLSAVTVVAVGFLLAAVLPTVRTTQAVAAAIYFPTIFVSGAVVPVEALPALARRVGDVLPFTYGVRAIRAAWTVGAADWAAFRSSRAPRPSSWRCDCACSAGRPDTDRDACRPQRPGDRAPLPGRRPRPVGSVVERLLRHLGGRAHSHRGHLRTDSVPRAGDAHGRRGPALLALAGGDPPPRVGRACAHARLVPGSRRVRLGADRP